GPGARKASVVVCCLILPVTRARGWQRWLSAQVVRPTRCKLPAGHALAQLRAPDPALNDRELVAHASTSMLAHTRATAQTNNFGSDTKTRLRTRWMSRDGSDGDLRELLSQPDARLRVSALLPLLTGSTAIVARRWHPG